MGLRSSVALLVCWVIAAGLAVAAEPPTITAAQAIEHVGKRVTVCGEIVSVGKAFSKRNGGKQVFLHFDKEPPDSPFVAVVIGYDLEVYWHLEKALHRKACATGYVKHSDRLIYAIVDRMDQMTFADANASR